MEQKLLAPSKEEGTYGCRLTDNSGDAAVGETDIDDLRNFFR